MVINPLQVTTSSTCIFALKKLDTLAMKKSIPGSISHYRSSLANSKNLPSSNSPSKRSYSPTKLHYQLYFTSQLNSLFKRSHPSAAFARWVRPAPNASIHHQARATPEEAKKPCIHSDRRPCSPSEPGSRSREAPGNGLPIRDSRAVTFGQRKQG